MAVEEVGNAEVDTSAVAQEPNLFIGVITAAVVAVLAVAIAFGAPLTEDQQFALVAAIGPVGVLVLAILARRKTTPSANVVEEVVPRHAFEVVAGEANEISTGIKIRKLGSLPG